MRSNSDHIISPPWSKGPVELKEIERENLAVGRELGQGEFGSVLMGVWSNPNGEKVCVIDLFHNTLSTKSTVLYHTVTVSGRLMLYISKTN